MKGANMKQWKINVNINITQDISRGSQGEVSDGPSLFKGAPNEPNPRHANKAATTPHPLPHESRICDKAIVLLL